MIDIVPTSIQQAMIGIAAILYFIAMPEPLTAQPDRFSFRFPSMGTEAHLVFYAADTVRARALALKANLLLDSLELILSDYNPDSEVCRLAAAHTTAWMPLSPVLKEVLTLSGEAFHRSKGGFDCSIGALTILWRAARKSGTMPSRPSLHKALKSSGWKKVELSGDSLRLREAGIRFDFGGIAKGYAAQQVVDFLRAEGIRSALVDMGGDMAVGEPPPGKNAWDIAINHPVSGEMPLPAALPLSQAAIATSGKLYQYLEIGSRKYSHIIRPQSGKPLLHNRQVTVIAPDGATADWLATACSVLPPRKALRLAQSLQGVSLLLLEDRKGKIRTRKQGMIFASF